MSEENTDDFERSLKRALKRVDARAEMRARFLAIAAEAEQQHRQTGRLWVTPRSGGRLFFLPKIPVWATGAIAALLLVGVFSVEQVREKHERVALADRDFAVSQQVTEQALEHTREQLQRAGIALDGD